ncbi:MAG: hypothetical protein OXE43_03485 [Chloroflexi bacterium]|nr:hypothetical protein [Chloroflexota bacterium]
MVSSDGLDARELTFSQAHGYETLPQPLKLEEVSTKARNAIWNVLYVHVYADHAEVNASVSSRLLKQSVWFGIFYTLHTEVLGNTADQFNAQDHVQNLLQYREDVLYGMRFNKLFDFLQTVMRHPSCPGEVIHGIAKAFHDEGLAYFVDTEGSPTIVPAATPEEGSQIREALDELHRASLDGAVAHLKDASACINVSDWSGSIRESIHAVESVARILDPKAASTLGPALTSLEKQGRLHPALKKAFSNLYGYTSDEQGIRHALLEDVESPAGRDEAVFMLGACASFASYLWRRHQDGTE